MQAVIEKKELLREVDIIKDRDYILEELEKSKSEKGYSFEESYNMNLEKLNNLRKNYEVI